MPTPEFSHEQPATPEQASALLGEISTLTTLRGRNYGDRNTFGTSVTDMPTEIAAHLPSPDDLSVEVKESAYVERIFDRETGQPKRDDVVGMVTFTRIEKPDKDLSYAAHVNYHVTTEDDGATYDIERHVTNTEHGFHKVREMRRAALDPAGLLEELTALRDRVIESHPIEKAMGMFTVTQAEAQQVIDFTKALNDEQ